MVTPKAGEKPEGTPEATPAPKTFTQEEVNALMGKTRAEERSKFQDYDKFKARAKVADTLEAAQLTDKEKAEHAAAEWQRKATDAAGRVADVAIRAEIKVKAVQKGIVDPDAAVALIDRSGIVYSDEEGVKGVAEALDALVAAKPYLRAAEVKPVAGNLNPGGGGAPKPTPQLTDAQRNVARRMYPELAPAEAAAKYSKGLPPAA